MEQNRFAIVSISGRQFRVSQGDTIQTAFFSTAKPGDSLDFSEVLMLHTGAELKLGQPFVKEARVTAQVVDHGRQAKIIVFKYLRKNKSKKMRGHRQPFTTLTITGIEG